MGLTANSQATTAANKRALVTGSFLNEDERRRITRAQVGTNKPSKKALGKDAIVEPKRQKRLPRLLAEKKSVKAMFDKGMKTRLVYLVIVAILININLFITRNCCTKKHKKII